MGLFGFGRKKTPAGAQPTADGGGDIPGAAQALADLLENKLNEPGRGVRVEDLLSAAAAITGQACIRAAGDYDPDDHDFVPGAAVFSERVNHLLAGDAPSWERAPETCVFMIIRRYALANGYAERDFPPLEQPFATYAAGLGGDLSSAIAQYGRIPLSVPEDNRPRRPPLQEAWGLRTPVAALLVQRGVPAADRLAVCALGLAVVLTHVKDAIDHAVAIRLALETVNGMAKTAPMTPRRWAEAAAGADTKTPEG